MRSLTGRLVRDGISSKVPTARSAISRESLCGLHPDVQGSQTIKWRFKLTQVLLKNLCREVFSMVGLGLIDGWIVSLLLYSMSCTGVTLPGPPQIDQLVFRSRLVLPVAVVLIHVCWPGSFHLDVGVP